MATLRLLSPLSGVVRPVSAVPDVVFAEQIIGPGVAIEPERSQTQHVVAPADGVVGALHPHAFALELADERSVLVHLGIDTVTLAGLGFTLHVRAGEAVTAGQRLVSWSPVDVAAAGLATICPVVALQAPEGSVVALVADGVAVAAGDPLLDWY
ncbi:PTS sugar transporter subunit IIA [Cellulomonas edaphi]|uniref:PTS glucose transporter subunit IIA n=1 Tax=Cellulomonas edaphi TaxID=3053468 RepID=A0ABT7SAG9_9CELL|nr:PTS glucose transporter subunit IIA [Cellulomons edaphi]MDM7832621.1 PTS glucose transporter subunit IIA [Cellulomons edaphi]